jgi:spermidine synthase
MTSTKSAAQKSQTLSWIILPLFLASGFCGLVYQVVWTRQLTLVFGVTTYAVSAVLTAFFAGLALGSFLAGKLADRRHAGLRTYGWIEIAIGLYALLVPLLFQLLNGVYRFAYQELGASFYLLSLLRLLMSALVLIVPTTLMGATLPVITRALIRRIDRVGWGMAGLYALNTFGAAVGVAASGFVLIGAIGLWRTTLLAAAVNVLIGVIAILLGMRTKAESPAAAEKVKKRAATHAVTPAVMRLVILGIGLSGIASIGLEVVWTRILAMYLSSSGSMVTARLLGDFSTYAFAAMLCSVLLGIVIGSLIIAPRLDRLRNPVGTLAILEILVCITTLLAAFCLATIVPGRGEIFILVFTFFILLVPNALLGATVPLAGKIHTRSIEGLGRGIGDVYSANVFGGVLGSFLAGFVLVPLLGSQATLIVLAMISLAVGALLARAVGGIRRTVLGLTLIPAVGLVLFLLLRPGILMDGIFRTLMPHHRVLFNKEEAEGMVSVTERVHNDTPYYFLLIGGRLQASDEQISLFIHRQLAHLPILFHPEPKEILVVGLGGGSTVGGAIRYPMVEQIDVVELVPGVVEAARLFDETNFGALDDPRVNVILGDGRNYLLVSEKKYDIIEADIIPPRHAMATNLYSADYYRLVKSRLKPGGMVCQWFDRSLPPELYKMLLRTFLEAFPNTTVWQAGMFAVAFPDGMTVDEELKQRVRERFAVPEQGLALHQAGLPSAEEFLSTYWKSPDGAREYVGPGLIVRDDRPYVEYFRSQVSGDVLPSHTDPGWR